MLARISMPTSLVRQSNGFLYAYGIRLCVPDVSKLRSRVLYELHDAPTAGHLDITRLLAAATFWWPNMKWTIKQHVRIVLLINVTRQRARHKPYGVLQPHEVPIMPFEHVSLDLIIDLPECDGYDVVAVFVCMLTKRTIVEPTAKTLTTKQSTKVMHRAVFWHFGLSRKLISDRDPRIMSEFWQTLLMLLAPSLILRQATILGVMAIPNK
jgi:hypothetical protein